MKSMKWALLAFFAVFFAQSFAQPVWMRYPAISPDGKQIVFSFKGDIYKVDAEGGMAVPLTIHPSHDYRPVWSPNGKSIAFASDRYGNFDVFIIPAEGGSARRLTYHSTNEVAYSFTPDGQNIVFSGRILDDAASTQFPYGRFSELYNVNIETGDVNQLLTTPAEEVVYSTNGDFMLYQDYKGYEDPWRKHHTSAVTRDLWKYNIADGSHTQLSSFKGEDRYPVLSSDQQTVYYLSEQFGTFNVCKFPLSDPAKVSQVSSFKNHPLRFLTISENDVLCYGYNGEIYTQTPGQDPQKVNVEINLDNGDSELEYMSLSSGANEMDLSPNGKEIAFIVRGEVFVTSTEYGTTKRITSTPEQERSVSFSPDGRSLVYASERNGSWNLYQSTIVSDDDLYFSNSTLIKEEPILEIDEETFQPHYSPDGKEVAYLENRVILKVINLKTKAVRTILDGKYNYSYSDGDQWYQWSPDSKWFLVDYTPNHWMVNEIGLVPADGSGKVINITKSGYGDNRPQWMMKGNAMIWFTDKNGMRNHGSWGATDDVYALFFNQESFDQFKLTKEELELKKEAEKEKKKDDTSDDKKKDKKGDDKEKADELIKIQMNGLEDRKQRLTIHSSSLAGALLSPEGDKLYYLSRFEKGHDLWVQDFKKNETKKVAVLDGQGGYMQADSSFNNIFVMSGGKIMKISTSDNSTKAVSYKAEMYLDTQGEREAMLEHAWRQVMRKWYRSDLHNVDWEFYKSEYSRFLPFISNNYDFSEMMSELLGEMNGSHTGCRYYHSAKGGDQTAHLGLFYDNNYDGLGLKITEVMDKSPVVDDESKIATGVIIEKIDGVQVTNANKYKIMNHKAGKPTLLGLYSPASGQRWNETVKPITQGQEDQLLYERWIKNRREETEKLSNGTIGYVHVRGMDSPSFREFYSEVLGRNHDKKALIVDTRFNGGGWLHDDLVTFLSGKRYVDYYPGGRFFGSEPIAKWNKPSCVLMSEGNYSDAHAFPFAYHALEIGKLIGMPVPGTMTAVWWERMQDPSLVFGIPQVGAKDMNGQYLENSQLEPDVKVKNTYEIMTSGRDEQLEKAVEVMMEEVKE
ncbi:S41 family peptidase [Carboxylicivirga caseinilyticus]|uniref:S41 family peptidase n=1 Tax=Carboxylicivirga caseinilyticus TaxID=3417572 RepID=UPI003D340657|nr:PD40 domain-containing protein [Marinilabiliaceae bacterium A049]